MKSKSNNDSSTSMIHEGNFIADPLSIANVFSDFFSTVAESDFLQTNVTLLRMKFPKLFLPLIAVNLLAQIAFPIRY